MAYLEMVRKLKAKQQSVLTSTIIAGKFVHDCSFDKLFEQTLANPSVLEAMDSASTNLGRIRAFHPYFPTAEFDEIMEASSEKLVKSDGVASNMINNAQLFIKNSEFDLALRSYNLALAYATPSSPLIGKIYLESFFLAIQVNPHKIPLANVEDVWHRMIPSIRTELKSEQEIQDYCHERVFKVHGNVNEKVPSAGDYVKMVTDENKGRHLIVTQALSAGTTVIVENPYTSVLSDGPTWETKHCAKCFRNISRGIPCEGCVFVLYCSEGCRKADFKDGHQYECACLPYIHVMRFTPSFHLGLRSICKAGPGTLYDLYLESKDPNPSQKPSDLQKGFDPKTGRYDSDSYYQILNLAAHSDHTINSAVLVAFSVAYVLMSKTTFGDGVDTSEKDAFTEFIASAYLQHSLSFRYNAFGMIGDVKYSKPKTESEDPKPAMSNENPDVTSIFSLCSTMNHSCHPTVFRENLYGGKMAIITMRSLIPGEELSIGYGYHFMLHDFEHRQTRIMNCYRFPCNCVACVYKWSNLKDVYPKSCLLCTNCSIKLKHDDILAFENCILGRLQSHPDIFLCDNCENYYDAEELNRQRMSFGDQLMKAYQLVKDDEPLRALELLPACVEFYQASLSSPSLQVFRAQFLLQSAFQLIVHREFSEQYKSM